MKKLLFTLFITSAVMLLSSCIIVPPDFRHSLTLKNETNYNITDWYVENIDGNIFLPSETHTCPITILESDTIRNLEEDFYFVAFSLKSRPDPYNSFNQDYYYSFTSVYLDEDTVYHLKTIDNYGHGDFHARSVSPNGSASPSEPQFYLLDSNGNRIELHKVEK